MSDVQFNNCVFTFNNTVVRWIGSAGNNHGLAEVYIDGIFQKIIDTYSGKMQTKQVLFEKKGLSNDRIHTIKVVVKKDKNLQSLGYYHDVDYFESLGPVNFSEKYKEAAESELKVIMFQN